MTANPLVRLFEHNLWANEQIIRSCLALNAEQLDAEPQGAAFGSIRETLSHLVGAQEGYLQLLTLPVEARQKAEFEMATVEQSARRSGEGLLALAAVEPFSHAVVRTTDNWLIEPWIVMVQVINHATEHREQIKSMLSALGITPPSIDGWDFGEARGGAMPVS